MAYSAQFASKANFELAFQRIVRGQNKEYKTFFCHLYPSYQLGLSRNIQDIVDRLKRSRYEPSETVCVYSPKPNGVLRPLRLLTLTDQIVYQAIGNVVSNAYRKEQQKVAFTRSFGAVVAGATSPFFYRSWKTSYKAFDREMVLAFNKGNHVVADFDLVSFFELIDHRLLRDVLARRRRSSSSHWVD
jgi:retron-type reverse transcriptase